MEPGRQKNMEVVRWLILKTAGAAGYTGATETMLEGVVQDEAAATRKTIRDEVFYLQKRGLVDVKKHDVKPWVVTLTRHGRDVVDYMVDCEPGIARPKIPADWAK